MIKFFFPESNRIGLPISITKRIPILLNVNIILVFYFFLASYTRLKADPSHTVPFFIAVNGTSMLYILSLFLVKGKRYMIASVVSTNAVLLDILWIGILLPIADGRDMYRLAGYVIGSCVANSLLSLNLKQIRNYAFASFLVLTLPALFIYAPQVGGFTGDLKTIYIMMFLLFAPVNLMLYFTSKLSVEVITLAEKELAINKEKATALDDLIKNAKDSLKIGETLAAASAESKRLSDGIRGALKSIRESSHGMTIDSRSADNSNKEVVTYAHEMQTSMHSQNTFLEETSAAVTEIMATIRNIASLAEQRKGNMDSVLKKIEIQGQDIKRIMGSLDRIRASSKDVLGVASGILDISEKTNMLAMNASIEAAHAGNAGKGFAVISGEIRKLSQETQTSTKSIGTALSKNEEVVTEAVSIVSAYASHIAEVTKDVHDTFYAIEEIINGLAEISQGTDELTQATGNMVSVSHETRDTVNGVTEKITESSLSVEHISKFAGTLDEMIEKLNKDFSAIEDLLERVAQVGEQNIINIQKLDHDMDAITKQ